MEVLMQSIGMRKCKLKLIFNLYYRNNSVYDMCIELLFVAFLCVTKYNLYKMLFHRSGTLLRYVLAGY